MADEVKTEVAEATTEKKEVSAKFKDLVEQIEKLSVLELSELSKSLKTDSALAQLLQSL